MKFKPTLQAAIDWGATGVSVYCRRCARSKRFAANDALDPFGTHATFPEIERRSRCRDGRHIRDGAEIADCAEQRWG